MGIRISLCRVSVLYDFVLCAGYEPDTHILTGNITILGYTQGSIAEKVT